MSSSSTSSFSKLISSLDIYGWPIHVNYGGKEVYKTSMGVFCSFVTYALIIYNFAALSLGFLDGS